MSDRTDPDATIVGRYRRLVAEADAWFARALAAHRAEARCGRGCDGCCRGLFDVTPLDAALLRAGISGEPLPAMPRSESLTLVVRESA